MSFHSNSTENKYRPKLINRLVFLLLLFNSEDHILFYTNKLI